MRGEGRRVRVGRGGGSMNREAKREEDRGREKE